MEKTRNSLSENVRTKMAAMLNLHLAAAIDLHGQVKQAHWNIRGRQFIGLHKLFDKIAGEVEDWSDLLAERAGALGAAAEGTLQAAAAQSYLPRYTLSIADGPSHTTALADALSEFAGRVRAAIDGAGTAGDAVTADVLTGISRAADQSVWKLEAHLEPAHATAATPQGVSV